jgi:putative ABC transport system permease protein
MNILRDLRYGVRTLLKRPGFAAVAVLTLALGVGATTALFSVVYAVFEPMPYPKPDQLVMLWSKVTTAVNVERNSVSPGDFVDWKRRSTSFQAMGAWSGGNFNVATSDRPEQIEGSPRTPGFFTMEGIPLFMGRDFVEEEGQPGKNNVVILSNKLWSKQFGADPQIIGKQIRMNSEPYTVVGVLQPGMYDRLPMQLWVPLAFTTREQENHDAHFILVMARLKDGVSVEQAQTEMSRIAAQMQTEYPKSNTNWDISVQPLHLNFLEKSTRRNLWLLLGAVGFLLLIGCVNVANLLLARGTARQREVALRAALGASKVRLFNQFLIESFVLAFIGGALGIVLAGLILDAMQAVMPPVGTMLPSEADIRISVPVLLFTLGVTTVSGLLFGTGPALQATRLDLNEILKSGGRTGSAGSGRNALRLLVVAEFSLALTLLASGGLAFKGFWNLTKVDLGIRPDHVLTFQLPVSDPRMVEPDRIRSYYRQMLEKIENVPGVKHMGAMTGVPARGPFFGMRINVVGQPVGNGSEQGSSFQMVTPGCFEALGIQLIKGRSIDQHDTELSPRVAVVNETFVKRYLAGVDPLTQRIAVDEIRPDARLGKPVEWQIVGVFHNTRGAGIREEYPEMFVPFAQSPWPQSSIVVRSEGDPKALIKSIAAAINSVDPDLPLAGVKTIDEIVGESLAIDRFSTVLFASFAALGLLLAAVGIYGVMAFGVAQRTHEFGIRMALGAQRARVITQVLKEGFILAGVGTLIGLGGAYLVGRAMQSNLYGVGALDGRTFAVVSVLLVIVAVVACLFPALRASKVEPLTALKTE